MKNHLKNHFLLIAFVLCFSVFLLGCRDQSKLPGLVPVRGKVIFNEEPLPAAAVTFIPKEQQPGNRSANAITDENGDFRLMTLNPNDGIFPGEYIVTVVKYKVQQFDDDTMRKARIGEIPMTKLGPQKPLVPEKYMDPKKTDLTYVIGPKGDKNIVIELKD